MGKYTVRPDQSWVPLISGTACNILLETYIMGVIGVELENKYGYSRTLTASVAAIQITSLFVFGVLGSGLYMWYGCKVPIILGAVINSIAYLCAAFTYKNPILLCIFVGFLSGIGHSLIYSPTMIVVNTYYIEKRQLANGIMTSGTGFGTFLMPPIHAFLLNKYGVFGTYLVLSGIELHNIVLALLIPPLATAEGFSSRYMSINYEIVSDSSNKQILYGTVEQQNEDVCPRMTNWMKTKDTISKSINIVKHDLLALDLFRNKKFILFTFGVGFFNPGLTHVMYTYLPDFATKAGINNGLAWLPLTILGICFALCEIFSGIRNKSSREMWIVFLVCQFIVFIVFLTLPFIELYFTIICIESGVFGIAAGFLFSARGPLTSEIVDERDIHRAIGLQCTLVGCFSVLTPLLGKLYDWTKSYMAIFLTTAAMQLLSFICNLTAFVFHSIVDKSLEV